MTGRPTASPITVIMWAPSASTVSHTSSGSSGPRGRIDFPPAMQSMSVTHDPAACMNGASSMALKASTMRSGSWASSVIGPVMRVGSPPPRQAKNASSWRHTTPLGRPVVPPV